MMGHASSCSIYRAYISDATLRVVGAAVYDRSWSGSSVYIGLVFSLYIWYIMKHIQQKHVVSVVA